MSHLKRLKAQKSWPLNKRKGIKFIARPSPGPHKLSESITINLILKGLLGYASTTKEVKLILNQGLVLIDGKIRKDHKFPVGIMDTISIKQTGQNFILLYDENGKYKLHQISKEEIENKPYKIAGKKILKKKQIQLNFNNGNNLIVDKDSYKVGDTIIMQQNKIKRHLKFEKGAFIYLIGGKHVGKTGILEEIKSFAGLTKDTVTLKTDKGKITTKKDHAFVIDGPFKK